VAEYRVLLYSTSAASSGGFGVNNLLAEFENAKFIGWEKYLNDVGSAFWTVNQDDPKLTSTLRTHKGKAHFKILRDNEVVMRGLWSESDAIGDDVIFYGYGYEHLLYSLHSDWNVRWQDTQIDDIVTDLWTYAKTTLTYSPVGFVSTGTIQAPVTTSGGGTAIELPLYRLYHKRILFAIRELAALSISDTTNTVYFELTYTSSPTDNAVTFNFWKNKSTDQADVMWEYPNGLVRDFKDTQLPVLARNDLALIGSAPNDILLRQRQQQSTGTFGYETFGRRQEPLFFAWVRDEDELDRVGKLRLARAIRPEPDIRVMLKGNDVKPPGATGAGWTLGDRVKVKLKRGLTDIDQYMFVSGVQVMQSRGVERVVPWLMDRSGS
jgi:hypothetical protein